MQAFWNAIFRSTFGLALLSALALWLALPPADLWPLAWIAPIGWLLLIRRPQLPGRRPYVAIYLAGFLFWMAAYYWLVFPHWATSIGWVALSVYLGAYLPVFIGLSRVAVHRWRMPLMFAAPCVWTGLELFRAHFLTGITLGDLGHTQYHWTALIQISDLAGAYGVSFVVLFVAACLAQMLPSEGRRGVFWPMLPAAALMAAVLGYGLWRQAPAAAPVARIALIQGAINTEMKAGRLQSDEVYQDYCDLSWRAVDEAEARQAPLDLIVWPETMFRYALVEYDSNAAKPADFRGSDDEFQQRLPEVAAAARQTIMRTMQAMRTPMLLGIDAMEFRAAGPRFYNSAVMVNADGALLRYDKMHPVLFGEYMPFVQYLPWLQRFTPMLVSLSAGTAPANFPLETSRGKLRLSPSICYENVLPHLIRRQIRTLAAKGEEPDVLVCLTNDGWFHGSSELDMHLACAVFRAVECRKPMLVAANTGFSAWIDGNGRIVKQGPRRKEEIVVAEVGPDRRSSWYLRFGDWPAGLCLLFCLALASDGLVGTLRGRQMQRIRRAIENDPNLRPIRTP